MVILNAQVLKLGKALANGSLANTKLSKTQLHKKRQSEGFLGRLLGPLLKAGLLLMGKVLKPLDKKVSLNLGLKAVASATDVAIHKKMFRSGTMAVIISNEEMNDIMKIIRCLQESGLLT